MYARISDSGPQHQVSREVFTQLHRDKDRREARLRLKKNLLDSKVGLLAWLSRIPNQTTTDGFHVKHGHSLKADSHSVWFGDS